MILNSHVTIDMFVLETAKDRSEIIGYVTKQMERNLVEALLEKIEPDKDYKIKLHGADLYDDYSKGLCAYKMALEVDGWTPCSEMMPAIDDFVLLSGVFEEVTKIIIAAGAQVRYWGSKIPGLAWMPLPEPYEESE